MIVSAYIFALNREGDTVTVERAGTGPMTFLDRWSVLWQGSLYDREGLTGSNSLGRKASRKADDPTRFVMGLVDARKAATKVVDRWNREEGRTYLDRLEKVEA